MARVNDITTIYEIIRKKQPEVIEELRKRFGWVHGQAVQPVVAGGQVFRDVTAEVAAASEIHPGREHGVYRRYHGRKRQVK